MKKTTCGAGCLLEKGHLGFHKSNHDIWVNEKDGLDWSSIGRRLMDGESMPNLSLVEIMYALKEAYKDEIEEAVWGRKGNE